MTELRKVELSYEDLKIAYEVREKSVIDIADTYGIKDEDVKTALRAYGIKVRKLEPKRTTEKDYEVVYTTPNKLVSKKEVVEVVTLPIGEPNPSFNPELTILETNNI